MKRLLIMFITMVMAVGAVATAEAKQPQRTERTVQGTYGAYPTPVTGCNEPEGKWACLSVPTRSTERFFTAKVTDTHGQPVYVEVGQGTGERIVFCGETKEPIAIRPGAELSFSIGLTWPHPPALQEQVKCTANRVKTTGTIKVTLSNR